MRTIFVPLRRRCAIGSTIVPMPGIAVVVLLFAILIWLIRSSLHGRLSSVRHSDPFPSAKRSWKVALRLSWIVGMLAMGRLTYVWYDYQQNKPTVPQPEAGRVYAERMRGATVYLTQREKARLEECFYGSFGSVLAGFLIFGILQ